MKDRIRAKLGFKNPKLYRLEAIRDNLVQRLKERHPDTADDLLYRGTGRTTEVLVTALAEFEQGKMVVLKADNLNMEAFLWDKFHELAFRLGHKNLAGRVFRHSEWKKHCHIAVDHPLP